MTARIDPRALTHDERELVHHIGRLLWTMAVDLDEARPEANARHVLARLLNNSDRDRGRTRTPLLLDAVWRGCADEATSQLVDEAAGRFPARYRIDGDHQAMIDFAWSLAGARDKAETALAEGEAEQVRIIDLADGAEVKP